jgi:hypothetical protein
MLIDFLIFNCFCPTENILLELGYHQLVQVKGCQVKPMLAPPWSFNKKGSLLTILPVWWDSCH